MTASSKVPNSNGKANTDYLEGVVSDNQTCSDLHSVSLWDSCTITTSNDGKPTGAAAALGRRLEAPSIHRSTTAL